MQLPHLQGVRCLCAAWVLCSRFLPSEHAGIWRVGQLRGGECGAACFMVLSGFVAQWQPALELRQLRRFFLRRFLRLWPAAWLAMAWSLALQPQLPRGSCLLLLQWSKEEAMQCPNGATWTASMLLPCWLIFPCLSSPLCRPCPKLTFAVVVGLWLLSCLWPVDGPVMAMPSFILGVAAAFVVQASDKDETVGRMHGILADLIAVGMATVVTFVGQTDEYHRYLALPTALFFLLATAGGGMVQALLRHKALASLGDATLYVYLFQEPLFESLAAWEPKLRHSAEGFVFFVLLLWLLAGLYAAFART
ncbi:unnamed protein product [Effrenium voratum]|nr:unnamed protein product [Effrenium voratum]CAJ1431959.1 unnamed protein product [Effrenium voratum]